MSLTSCFCTSWKKEVVRSLEFRHCNLHFVPTEVYDFEESLEELYLDSNNIKELPRSLFHCEYLKKLGASDNELCTIPTSVATLIHLEELDISKNGIVELPDNIKCCKNLKLVEISVNPLGRLPEGFTHLINLTELYLNDTLLDFLPANFGRLTKLKVLELRENHLQTLPKSICRLTELERLDLGQNDFKELPDVVGTLINLRELWIDSNRIVQLPKSIGNLQLLTYFDASCNRIEILPEEMQGLRSLVDLHLSMNYIQELPKNIGKLSKLTTLKIDCNQLCSLPYSIGGLSSLEEFYIKANDLEDIPASIGLLRKLRHLNIDQNMLLSVPAELGSCSNITVLSLSSNYLRILPDEMGRISSLTVLNLSNNNLKYLPYSFTKLKKVQAMWLSDNQAKPMLQLQSEIIESTGKRILTCFMFPQVRRDPEDDICFSDTESFHNSLWEEKRRKNTQIAFDVSESENELEHTSSIIRSPTPFPVEGVRRMANFDTTPWHSSPIIPRNAERVRALYPKEGIKQRHLHHKTHDDEVPEHLHRLADRVNGINALPNRPNIDTGKGRHGAKLREAKIARPRTAASPIGDSLQLFRADKEKMAKDKLRIRHSSPEKTESEAEAYSPKKNRVLGRRELNKSPGNDYRTAMSDSEAFSPGSISTSKGGRALQRKIADTQSDYEHSGFGSRHVTVSDTQSDVGFRIHGRRSKDNRHDESQSDVEFRVRGRRSHHRASSGNPIKTKVYDDIDGVTSPRRDSEPYTNSPQLNRNTNAATDTESPMVSSQKSHRPRRSGYGTDPELERSRRRKGHSSEIRSEVTDDEGYVNPSNYYKLPEYSEKKNPPRTLDLTPLRVKGNASMESPQKQGKTQEVNNSMQHVKGQDAGLNLNSQHRRTPLMQGSPEIQGRSKMQTRIEHDMYPYKSRQKHSINPENRVPVHSDASGKDYVDMASASMTQTSTKAPVRSQPSSPTKSHIPSYEEALARRITPPPVQSTSHPNTSDQPVRDGQKILIRNQEDAYELMRSQNEALQHRSNGNSPVKEAHRTPHRVQPQQRPIQNSQVKEAIKTPQRKHPQQERDSVSNVKNAAKNVNSVSLERLLKPLEIGNGNHSNMLHNGSELGNRLQDGERDSGNSSNVTLCESDHPQNGWSSHQDVMERSKGHRGQAGTDGPKRFAGINGRKEIQPDLNTGNETDSALTESPSPTYSSSGLTPSPQQPHFPPSTRIPMSPDGKVPLLPGGGHHVMPQGFMPPMKVIPKGMPPPYQARWNGRPEPFPRDSSGYASESEYRRGSPSSPSSFLIDNRPPSPNSTVLAWDTSAINGTPLPNNNNSTTNGQMEGGSTSNTLQLVIYKNPGLGFSITGGWQSPGNPYKPHDMGIFVTKIAPSGPADGTLNPGDKILEVNGRDFTNVTHDDAVNLLRSSNPVSLVVQRD